MTIIFNCLRLWLNFNSHIIVDLQFAKKWNETVFKYFTNLRLRGPISSTARIFLKSLIYACVHLNDINCNLLFRNCESKNKFPKSILIIRPSKQDSYPTRAPIIELKSSEIPSCPVDLINLDPTDAHGACAFPCNKPTMFSNVSHNIFL